MQDLKDIALNDFGAYDGTYKVPKDGSVGWYSFALIPDYAPMQLSPMRVLVADFTPASFHVTSELNGTRFHAGDNLEVDTLAHLHSGGPYADAGARVTVMLVASGFSPSNPDLQGFSFDTFAYGGGNSQQLFQTEEKLNDQGELKTDFKLAANNGLFGRLAVESAVRDDRGKYIAGVTGADYFGRDRYVGLKEDAWLLQQGKNATVHYAVVDDQGKIQAGTAVNIVVKRMVTKAARVKSAGDVYLVHYTTSWTQVAQSSAN